MEGAGTEKRRWGCDESSADFQPCGPGFCGGGSVTHMQKHTQRDACLRAAHTSPPAVEAAGRQCRDATGTYRLHTLFL